MLRWRNIEIVKFVEIVASAGRYLIRTGAYIKVTWCELCFASRSHVQGAFKKKNKIVLH